ncbi:hypothetical protein [Actinosynnema sp. ALI-1.44]|uniref:hypothetical protein n=1 Tax=Actinosynnema sp. ALI-1.44 TaxID=1933779 RepID=UPI001178495D|nr:hypothetical protein [Actinosynnema sp. ALI-1.44]
MLTRLVLVAALLLAGACTTNPVPSPSGTSASPGQPKPGDLPKWIKSSHGVPVELGRGQRAGWDGGLLVADDGTVRTSKDGREWRVVSPEGVVAAVAGEGHTVAGYGSSGYFLAWSDRGLTVWRTEDGQRWHAVPLDPGGLKIESRERLKVEITAGPRGVLVVGVDNFHPPSYQGVYVWMSTDGQSFGSMTKITKPDEETGLSVDAVATSSGFLMVAAQTVLSSVDGTRWQDVTAGLPDTGGFLHVSGNASTVVLFARKPNSEAQLPQAWYRRDGVWRQAKLDPGRLPDAGVVPADEVVVTAMRDWGSGFIAVGHTYGGEGREEAGLVWYSADGSGWTRMPVRDNEFHTVLGFDDVTVSRNKAVLLGASSHNSDTLVMWHAEAPPLPKRVEPSVQPSNTATAPPSPACGELARTTRNGRKLEWRDADLVPQVHKAACQRDYETLQRLMPERFTYNTRHASASDVITSWRNTDPQGTFLDQLARVLETSPDATQAGLLFCGVSGTVAGFSRPTHQAPEQWTLFGLPGQHTTQC